MDSAISSFATNHTTMKSAILRITDEQQDAASQTAYAVSRAILQGDWSTLDGLLDEKFTYTGDGFVFSKDQYIGFMQDMRAAFSDFEMILDRTIASGEFASIRFTSHVVNTGSFMGSPANSKNLTVCGIFQRHCVNGKVMQEWQTTDLLGTMNQIGFGAMFGYAVFVTGFGVKQKPIVRKPADFLHLNGKVEHYDQLDAKGKNQYVKAYIKAMKSK